MTIHQAVSDGVKPFELRKDDRPYSVGDTLRLREYEPMTNTYTGRVLDVQVTYCLRGFPGIEAGYVVLGTQFVIDKQMSNEECHAILDAAMRELEHEG